MIVGSGQFQYRINAEWATRLPDVWSFKEVGGVGIDGDLCSIAASTR
jgi:hypothetical protein